MTKKVVNQRPGAVDEQTAAMLAKIAAHPMITGFDPQGDIEMTREEQFGQTTTEAQTTNLKRIVDDYADLANEKARRSGSLQDKINDQYLTQVAATNALVMRMAGNNATIDHLVNSSTASGMAAQNTEFRGIGAQVAEQAAEAATAAVNSAMATTAMTTAPAQGTTGVAQGGLQMQVPVELAQILANSNTTQAAILAELAKIDNALSVLLVREVATPVPATT